MANQEHLAILKQGVKIWNRWREEHPEIRPDLSATNLQWTDLRNADLSGAFLDKTHFFENPRLTDVCLCKAHLVNADLSRADLSRADLREADLTRADLRWAKLCQAHLSWAILEDAHLNSAHLEMADLSNAWLLRTHLRLANLSEANLRDASLIEVDLSEANLSNTDLRDANLCKADLQGAILKSADLRRANLLAANLIETNFCQANMTDCSVYGISVWNVKLEGAIQANLIVTPPSEPQIITVDSLEVAQFIYLLLNNQKIRQTIDTITSQVVLILGTFTPDRTEVIDALTKELRSHKYLPVVFNFEGADNKDFTETVRTLANMVRFVLIDLTHLDDTIRDIANDIVPRCVVPIRPLLLQDWYQPGYELFRELQHKHRWVLAPYRYKDLSDLHTSFQERILQPINEKIIELKHRKPLKIFIGYAPEDKNVFDKLKPHLRLLERAGLIEIWDDQDLAPGEERGKEIERQLSDARIILLLISPAFLISHDCYDVQMSMAVERHSRGEARVIPILLRPCAWQSTPLKELQPLPKDGKPISKHNKDDVFFEVSEDIGEVIKILR